MKLKDEDLKEIAKLVDEGNSYKKIASIFGNEYYMMLTYVIN